MAHRGSSLGKEAEMLEQVHDHIVGELGQSSRTDTIFVVTAVIFNLVVLGINSGVSLAAIDRNAATSNDIILAVFIVMTLLITAVAVIALVFGMRTRRTLLKGLISMYQDNQVDKYYDPSLLSNYGVRYLLFTGVIVTLALAAIVVPLVIRFL
jgi:hypothetical protein